MPRRKPDPPPHEHSPLLALAADVGHALAALHTLPEMLQGCADALHTHLNAVAACVWTLDPAHRLLCLQASAGLVSGADGSAGHIPFDLNIVNRIVRTRLPCLTNRLPDELAHAAGLWAAEEGITAFAGCPLIVEQQLVGVAAVFARQPFSPAAFQAVELVADQIAVGIERNRAMQALQASEERYRAAFAHAAVGVTLADLHDRCLEANAAFCALTGYSEDELVGRDFPSLTHPDDRADSRAFMARLRSGETASVVMEKRYLRRDGSVVWVQNSVALVRDADGSASSTIALTEDISRRKQAEAEREEATARQWVFARDVLASVTEGRLVLCQSKDQLPPPPAPPCPALALSPTEGLAALRQAARTAARQADYTEERVGDLVIAAREAGMNAIVHAETGTASVSVSADGTVQVRVEDHGGGITLENLPRATLARGFSTKATMGYGLKMMLETADRLYLLTGPGGTTVVLEQQREKPLSAPV